MSRCKADICDLQDMRWRGASVRLVEKIPVLSCSGYEIMRAWVELKFYWQKSGEGGNF